MQPLSYHMVDALQPPLSNPFEHAADDLIYSLPRVRWSSALFVLWPRDVAL